MSRNARVSLLFLVSLGALLGHAPNLALAAADDITKLEERSDGFYHKPSAMLLRMPAGFDIRGTRELPDGASLTLDKAESMFMVTLYWATLGKHTQAEIVNPKPAKGEGYGVEYDTLVQVYGEDKVSKPREVKVGDGAAYRIDVESGPGADQNKLDLAGVLYVFFVENEGRPWRIKLRATFLKKDREQCIKDVERIMSGYEQKNEEH